MIREIWMEHTSQEYSKAWCALILGDQANLYILKIIGPVLDPQ